MNPENCIVYVLTNEAMPDYIKIGTTGRPIQERMRDLYTTGLPVPFECYYAAEVAKVTNVERRLHRAFDKFRVNKNREFFELEPEAAADIIRMVAIKDMTPSDDVFETADDVEAIHKLEKRAERFNFAMVGITHGTTLTFKLDEALTCTVVDSRHVEFEGEQVSLSAAALSALGRKGFQWKSAQGAIYWMYEGKTLKELRDILENDEL